MCKLISQKTKNDAIQGSGELGKNYVISGQANSTDMLPDQKSKQSLGANLSLYKYLSPLLKGKDQYSWPPFTN